MTQEEQRVLTAQVVAPAQARAIVRRLLKLWDGGEPSEIAQLLTSELVTNAVVHATTEIMLRVEADPSLVRVEVTDTGAGRPAIRRPDVGGYGLRIVDRLASRWGVDPAGASGKVVWFELDLTPWAETGATTG
jgi:anti-sigma regulatory factor (Ser/Thr protein kinase)